MVSGQAPYLDRWLQKQHGPSAEERQTILHLFLALNKEIAEELGPDFLIGHSYFMTSDATTESGRERIWRRAIVPLLREYFHNRKDREELLSRFFIHALMKRDDDPQVNETAG